MATTYYTDIQKLYVAYFNRPADDAGLKYYEGVMEAANGSAAAKAQISADFAKSAEYTAAFSGKTSAQIVDIIYTNIFGHAADAAGNKFYADNLDAKKVTLADIVKDVAGGAQGSDLTAYNNKVTAAGLFTAALDTDVKKAGYSGDAANAVAKEFLSQITDNISLTTYTTPSELNSAVAETVAAGTPFSVPGILAQVAAAQTASDAFVKATVTTDVDGNGVKNAADITAAQTKALAAVAADLNGGASGANGTLFTTSTTSQVVRDALITAQQATNAGALSTAQAKVAADNAAIAQVAGLTDAVSLLNAALSAQKSAVAAELATNTDLTAKTAAFNFANGGTFGTTTSTTNGVTVTTAITFTPANSATVTLATVTDGKATLATGVDATKYTGLTDLIASYNAESTAAASLASANTNATNAQLAVNLLDIAQDNAGSFTVNGTQYTEKSLIAAIAAQINATTANTVATGATPTLSQIQTELAVLKATNTAAYNSFKALVDAEANTSTDAVITATGTVNTATSTLNTDKAAAVSAHSGYVTQTATFTSADPANAGTVSVIGNALVLTPTTGTAKTLATLDATTKVATVANGVDNTSNPGVTDLITKYNADVNAAAKVVTDTTALNNAKAALDAAIGAINPLTATQATDTAAVTAANDTIAKLAKDVAALSTATTNATTLAGYQAQIDAYNEVLKDKGYAVVTLDAAHSGVATQFGTAKSDVFIVKGNSATISAFGLQGTDSVFVGSGYTLVQGSLTGTGAVTGSDAAKEVFVSKVGADTVLQIETHAYSSSVVGGTGEIVTITLTGVDASTIKMDTNGIITAGTAAA